MAKVQATLKPHYYKANLSQYLWNFRQELQLILALPSLFPFAFCVWIFSKVLLTCATDLGIKSVQLV